MAKTLVSIRAIALYSLVAALLLVTRADLIADTCKSSPIPNVCNSVLRSDPRSKTADEKGFALIVVDAIEKKSFATLREIKKLMKSRPSGSLSECADIYNTDIIKIEIPLAKRALTLNNPKFAEGAIIDAGNETTDCENAFAPSPSPLTAFNNVVHDYCVVCEAIIKLLL